MNISGFQKLTLLDFPGKLAALIFTQGCNFKCSFCQNSALLLFNDEKLISETEIFEYLKKRQKVLDGLVVSGGEPTVQKDLKGFIKKVKDMGLLVKLDTNGSNPVILKELIDEKLIDYVAMDIKNTFLLYGDVIGIKGYNTDNIKKSIKILKESGIDFEFRTTIMKNYHDVEKIKKICKYIGPDVKYYLQNFKDSEGVLNKNLESFSDAELKVFQDELQKEFPNVKVRGL